MTAEQPFLFEVDAVDPLTPTLQEPDDFTAAITVATAGDAADTGEEEEPARLW